MEFTEQYKNREGRKVNLKKTLQENMRSSSNFK